MNKKILEEIEIIRKNIISIQKDWDGKTSILELKEANYNWKQMEWWAFYFEFKCYELFKKEFVIPGDKFVNVRFDMKRNINWDLKAAAIKSHNFSVILNDVDAMNMSIEKHKYHGELIGLCDVEYNDLNRSFQKWHTELKGGMSKYEQKRTERTTISRYRKTKAFLEEIVIVILDKKSLSKLPLMHQGINANGKQRKSKYLFELDKNDNFNFVSFKL